MIPTEGGRRQRASLAALTSVFLALGLLMLGARASGSIDAQACRASQFSFSFGRDLSPPTGRHYLSLRLRNRGLTCRTRGYPTVAFLDRRGAALPFATRRGGGMMVTSARPRPLVVRHARSAWILLEQYRCDLGGVAVARAALVGLPGATGSVRVDLPLGQGLAFCGRGDPGSTVFVSPVVKTQRAALHVYGRGP